MPGDTVSNFKTLMLIFAFVALCLAGGYLAAAHWLV